jgi:hypothetical protein
VGVAVDERSRRADGVAARTSNYGLMLAITVGLSCLDVVATLNQRWFPWDEGTLGQAALRVLEGQLPHRDFVDTYTGGLAFFDAGVFWVFGTDLLWLRVAMLPFFVGFVIAFFYLATRFMPPIAAALTTVTMVVWTVPNYPAAMPSWFNLFLATIGVAALARWLESDQRRWLWVAGLAGGLSIVVKIVGLYYVAGVALFLLVRRQLGGRPRATQEPRHILGSAIVPCLAGVSVLAVVDLVAPLLGWPEFIAFVIPVVAVAIAVAFVAFHANDQGSAVLRVALSELGPFLGGVAIPIVIFTVPYIASGSLGSLVHDLSQASHLRLRFAAQPPLSPGWLVAAVPLVLVALAPALPGLWSKVMSLSLAAFYIAAALLVPLGTSYQVFLNPLRSSVPVVCATGAVLIVLGSLRRRKATQRAELAALLVIVTAFTALIQFPFSGPIYFLYALPFVVLAIGAVLFELGAARQPLAVIVVAAYLISGLVHTSPGAVGFARGIVGSHPSNLGLVDAKRGRIYVQNGDIFFYPEIEKLLALHAQGGYTFAGPDAPEIYYLANLQNPTPMFYDFLTPVHDRDRYVLDAIARKRITAIVVNEAPAFSPPLDDALRNRLDRMFPQHATIQHFDVRWR